MSVLDLLTCALGSTVLISFLLIVSITKPAAAGFKYTYFAATAEVWIDVTDVAKAANRERTQRVLKECGPVPQTDVDALKSVLAEYEVELQVHWKQENAEDLSIPHNAKSLFRVNSAYSGLNRNAGEQGEAKFYLRTDTLGFHCVMMNNQMKLFAVYRLFASGFRINRGWYCMGLRLLKCQREQVGKDTAAWLRIESGGRPGAAIYQTRATFLDDQTPEMHEGKWPIRKGVESLREMYPALENFNPKAKLQAHEQMQVLRLPDAYLGGWPEQYPDAKAKPVKYELDYGLRTEHADWLFFFSLRHKRGSELPPAARFPVVNPTDVTKSLGWHRAETKDGAVWDHYLPGFHIGEEKKQK